MEGTRYDMDRRAYWGLRLLLERIREDFKNPETEAEYQKWLAEREQSNQEIQENQPEQ